MKSLCYYTISIPYVQGKTELDTVIGRVQYYNDKNYLLFDHYSNDGRLNFIYEYGGDDPEEIIWNEMKNLSNVLDSDDVVLRPLKAADMTDRQIEQVSLLKKIRGVRCGVRDESQRRWNTRSQEKLLKTVDGIMGFEDFKSFYHKLDVYTSNTLRYGRRGNYNVALINNCGIWEEDFIHLIYDLYAAKGILVDDTLIRGALWDAEDMRFNARSFFLLQEDEWYFSSGSDLQMRTRDETFLQCMEGKSIIYVTVLSKEQYRKASKSSIFMRIFAHCAELNEPTQKEKLFLLKSEVQSYGLSIQEEDFKDSPLLELPINALRSSVTAAATKKLYEKDGLGLLNPEDFDTKDREISASALEELEKLIGLAGVKQCIKEINTFLQRRGKDAVPCLHMVFRGNSGTGKTTVARLIGKLFGEIGIVERGDLFVETDREGLVGEYVGHTAVKTSAKIQEALGGVLFIDEAYSLGGSDPFSAEAISTLVKRMEDRRKDFVCIMAGYTEEMEHMLNLNPGLRDRIQFYIDFPDYDQSELMEIFQSHCEAEGYILTQEAQAELHARLGLVLQNKGKNFSNARLVRRVFERIKLKQAMRSTGDDIGLDDIAAAFTDGDILTQVAEHNARRIGF